MNFLLLNAYARILNYELQDKIIAGLLFARDFQSDITLHSIFRCIAEQVQESLFKPQAIAV